METELEAKFLDVDPVHLRATLRGAGARLLHTERLMRRRVYDFGDERLGRVGGWIRIRDEGDKITLSYKQVIDRSLEGTREATVAVNDFQQAHLILTAIGLEQKSEQETRRETWEHLGCEVTIDTWPWIPTFCEIEGPNSDGVKRVASDLGFDWGRAMHGSVEPVYQRDFDVTEEEVNHWETITFIPVPDWLEAKRRR